MVSMYLYFSMKVWHEIECTTHDTLPPCVKKILTECGLTSLLSINQINESRITEIENFVNENQGIIEKLDCCHAGTYKSLKKFRFLPAHRLIILHLPSCGTAIFEADRAVTVNYSHDHLNASRSIRNVNDTTEYSLFLRMLLESAKENAGIPKNRFRYDNILQWILFSTYIFLSCGRSCYETLSSNLPIPSKHTVCKFHIINLFGLNIY